MIYCHILNEELFCLDVCVLLCSCITCCQTQASSSVAPRLFSVLCLQFTLNQKAARLQIWWRPEGLDTSNWRNKFEVKRSMSLGTKIVFFTHNFVKIGSIYIKSSPLMILARSYTYHRIGGLHFTNENSSFCDMYVFVFQKKLRIA